LSLIIARFIEPSQYGLIAMITIFTAIAQTFVDSGFGNALIQKKDRNQTDCSTVFYFNLSISIILYAAIYLGAPLIAD
ncbi:MAG: oligosaccharide flippase family protein, partial [Allobaculum sp.]|nr:oligosaccharide flippase family protein [Allobaculum sp.]